MEDEEGEEDIMELKPLDDGSQGSKAKGKKSKKGKADQQDEEADLAPVSKGWGRHDFYGGEDAGDDSEGASDEDLTFKEAKKLEELRAARLQSLSDPLSALLGQSASEGVEQTSKASDADAEFEAVFAERAEKQTVQRDLTQLSDAKRKSLLKKESPELLPLLQNFQDNVKALLPLLALLKPSAKKRLPSSGASYLEARVSLLLNHLANLSFYLMMKAEGGDVRSHPVVSQLVWLRELGELMKSVDERVGTKLKKAVKQASKLPDLEDVLQEERPKKDVTSMEDKPEPAQKPALSLAERLARLRGKKGSEPEEKRDPQQSGTPLVSSLLRLPPSRRRLNRSAEGPADLDEIDPTLGAWMPSTSLSQQLSEVQQHLRERKAKAAPQASDVNPEPRARAHRERVQTEIDPRQTEDVPKQESMQHARSGGDEDGLGEVLSEANAKSKARKERKAAELSAKMKAKVAQQYHPEKPVEARSLLALSHEGKKKAGNARVANRQKYDKLVKRRKGAVQEMREGAADGATYDGEATGLRTNLRKSMKLG
ncbi:Utp3 [Symbiodinium pilosum]|uniref:Utp3 protein n=1 Tax=Symbiodinium pilosum TaxID=2952 RepID=A0A812Y933_SYMPI|nr:Utp3 [Symbiodinium pilosum]